jgi:hypothetical protein
MQTLTLRGVPASIQHDAWWLAASLPDPGPAGGAGAPAAPRDGTGVPPRVPVILGLVLLADLLMWDSEAGLGLAVFACAVFAAALILGPRAPRLAPAVAALVLAVLPVIEHVQPLSVLLLAAGLAAALVLARGTPPAALLPPSLRLLASLPFGGLAALLRAVPRLGTTGAGGAARRSLAAWAFPVGGSLVFATLLVDANPVLARWLTFDFDPSRLILRGMFWAGMALLLVPLLATPDTRPLPAPARLPHLGINAASTERALWMFNALIGVQTVMDLTIFAGGAALPAGMTYADYAHRGAYPLLATALLAGAFALAATPFLAERRTLRPLMLLWLAQNVALCLSALLRLEIYVEAYGLTYLRLHAAIWMALVAAGLALTAWQVQSRRPTRWLLLRVAALGGATLYLCAFVNFAALIAEHNLRRGFDPDYVCALGPDAAAAIAAARTATRDPRLWCDTAPRIEGWRDWGFRKWRIRRYLTDARGVPAEGIPER